MNILQRSLRVDANTANNQSNSKQAKTNVTKSLYNSNQLAGGCRTFYSNNDKYDLLYNGSYYPSYNYLNNQSDLFNSSNAFFECKDNLPFSSNKAKEIFNLSENDESSRENQEITSNFIQEKSSMSSFLKNNANYGKLFPPSCLQYLHQHNHLEEVIVAQQLLNRTKWTENQPIVINYYNYKNLNIEEDEFDNFQKYFKNDLKNAHEQKTLPIFNDKQLGVVSATHCPLNYEKNIISHYKKSTNDYFRISFLETNIYQPQDMPSSPQHLPHQKGNSQNFLHNEWVKKNLNNLRIFFKSSCIKILVNVEKKAKYPFLIFGNPGPKFNAENGLIMPTATSSNLSPELRISDGLYEIFDFIEKPFDELMNVQQSSSIEKNNPLGYIVSAYQTFPGEDSEKLEETWLAWTGGSHLYRSLPDEIGLRKLIFFKRRDLHLLKSNCLKQFVDNDLPIFTYVLLCELYNLKEIYFPATCAIVDQLRARCCGYTALYINCTWKKIIKSSFEFEK